MRSTRWVLTLALLVSPALVSAQVAATCDATTGFVGPETGINRPTCNITRNATTAIGTILRLGLVSNTAISLNATDTVAYEQTRTAVGGGNPGTTGTVVATPTALQSASARDSVIVQANRPYILAISGTTSTFTFSKDASYNVCRDSAVVTTCATSGTGNIAKPIGDLYWKGGAQATYLQMTTTATAAAVKSSAAGARYATGIDFSSAWFYATDIPGTYTATVQYTLTGQ